MNLETSNLDDRKALKMVAHILERRKELRTIFDFPKSFIQFANNILEIIVEKSDFNPIPDKIVIEIIERSLQNALSNQKLLGNFEPNTLNERSGLEMVAHILERRKDLRAIFDYPNAFSQVVDKTSEIIVKSSESNSFPDKTVIEISLHKVLDYEELMMKIEEQLSDTNNKYSD